MKFATLDAEKKNKTYVTKILVMQQSSINQPTEVKSEPASLLLLSYLSCSQCTLVVF